MSGEVIEQEQKNKGGRPRAVIWNFFIEDTDQGDGHQSATCSTCSAIWQREKVSTLERHILIDCKKIDSEVKEAVRYIVEAREKPPGNVTGKKQNINTFSCLQLHFLKFVTCILLPIVFIKIYMCINNLYIFFPN